jgi:hypothetical protein
MMRFQFAVTHGYYQTKVIKKGGDWFYKKGEWTVNCLLTLI